MEIKNSVENGLMTVEIVGAINYEGAKVLKRFLDGAYDEVNQMLINMAQVDYVSSAGMRVILEAELAMKKKNGLVLTNINELVKNALEVSGFDQFLNIQ